MNNIKCEYINNPKIKVFRLNINQVPITCCLQKIHLRSKNTKGSKVKVWKKIHHANSDRKKAAGTILISDKIGIKTKRLPEIKRDILSFYQE